jgi:SAM-dependent methyltransferase
VVSVDPGLQRSYDSYYSEPSDWRALGARDKAANIEALCGRIPHDTVLEIGAGEGSLLERLAALGFGREHYALEISTSGVECIHQRGIATLVECQQFEGYQIRYPGARFDLAVLSHVLEHVEHPRLLLNEAARVARHVFIEVPLEDTLRRPWDYVWDGVGHINHFSARTIRLLVQTCGHEVLEQRETNPSRDVYRYRLGRRGAMTHFVKEIALRAAPALARTVWTYHSCLLVRPGRGAGA